MLLLLLQLRHKTGNILDETFTFINFLVSWKNEFVYKNFVSVSTRLPQETDVPYSDFFEYVHHHRDDSFSYAENNVPVFSRAFWALV